MIEPESAENRYPALVRHAHWATAVLVLLAYATIYGRELLTRGSAPRLFVVQSHFLLGLLVLALTVPRIAARLRQKAPPIIPATNLPARLAAGTFHLILFVFLVVQPLLGVATRLTAGKGVGIPLTSWSFSVPAWTSPELKEVLQDLHESVGEAFIYILIAHALAALWHWKVRRDNTLQRML